MFFNHCIPEDKYDTLEYSWVKYYNGILCACGIFYMSIQNTNNEQALRRVTRLKHRDMLSPRVRSS
jgi:hypothetical protein